MFKVISYFPGQISSWILVSDCTSSDHIYEPLRIPMREVRRPLLSRDWVHSGVWVSLADGVGLLHRYVDLHRRSHLAHLRQRSHSREVAVVRPIHPMSATNPLNRKPWSVCVKVNEPKRSWELSELQVSPDHRHRFSHERHYRRPWLRSW